MTWTPLIPGMFWFRARVARMELGFRLELQNLLRRAFPNLDDLLRKETDQATVV
jgi:hypothetical protein